MPIERAELEALIEALIEEARRRARRRRRRYGAVVLLVAAVGIAAFIGVGGRGADGAGTAATARAPEGQSPAAGTQSVLPLAPLPADIIFVSTIAFDPRAQNTVYIAATSGKRAFRRAVDARVVGARVQDERRRAALGRAGIQPDLHARGRARRRPTASRDLVRGTGVAVYKTVNGGRNWRGWNRGLLRRHR